VFNEDADETPQADGYLTLLPYLAHESGEVTGGVCGLTPWGAPVVSGLRGFNGAGEPWLGILLESPTAYMRVTTPLQKKEYELLHLRRLAVDARAARGVDLFDAVVGEAEPPDFIVASGDQRLGYEMTQFAIPDRRQAQSLFFEVSARLADQQQHRISHLSGYQLYIWFGAASDAAGLPFKRSNQTIYDELLEAFIAHIPDPDQFRVSASKTPEQVKFKPVRTVADVQFLSIPLLGSVPASLFYAVTGLNVALAFQSDHTAGGEWAKLRAAVKRKDKPANNILVISVGAPDKFGRCFASEEVLADFMLEFPETLQVEHLSSVILHFWNTGRVVELLGEKPVALWPGHFEGLSPAFHPFRPLG